MSEKIKTEQQNEAHISPSELNAGLADEYGNTEDEFKFCSFPNCGCDGARLCMAPSGPNNASLYLNIGH